MEVSNFIGLFATDHHRCGTATTCPLFTGGRAQSIVKLALIMAIILLKCYPRIVSALNVVLLSQLGSALQHGV